MSLRFALDVQRAARAVERYLERRGLPHNLSPLEALALGYLSVYSPAPVGRLGEQLGVKLTTVSSLVKRLEARGFVRRRADAEDRRSSLLELTREGMIVAEAVHMALDVLDSGVKAATSEGEMDGFESVLKIVQMRVDAETNDGAERRRK